MIRRWQEARWYERVNFATGMLFAAFLALEGHAVFGAGVALISVLWLAPDSRQDS